tara:strand:+ start:388 stop:738 length:351 start_codon:yes stop_codon:yes gene_type:complete
MAQIKPRQKVLDYLMFLKNKHSKGGIITFETTEEEISKIKGVQWLDVQLWSYAAAWLFDEIMRGEDPIESNMGVSVEVVRNQIDEFMEDISSYYGRPVMDVVEELERFEKILEGLK